MQPASHMSELAPISITESKRLIELENIVKRGLKHFTEVGEALAEIRDAKLYRIEFMNFEDYCREKWGMSKTQANRLVDSAEVSEDLTPIGVKPKNEAQSRPLAKLESPQDRQAAWKDAVETSGGNPTARDVEASVRRIKPIEGVTLGDSDQKKVDEANGDSEALWLAKSKFKLLNKKDRAAFIKWAQNQ